MKRSSRSGSRSNVSADALLEAGRTRSELSYDVDAGLARHHQWLQVGAPLPAWANAPAAVGSASLVSVAAKVLLASVFVGALGFVSWHVLSSSVAPQVAPAVRSIGQVAATPVAAAPASAASEPAALGAPTAPMGSSAASVAAPHATSVRASTRASRRLRAVDSTGSPASGEAHGAGDARDTVSEEPAGKPSEPATTVVPFHVEPPQQATARAEGPTDAAEMRDVAAAEAALQASPARALALVRASERRFPDGYFRQERAYIEIMALLGLGERDAARAEAATFFSRYPEVPYGARIRQAFSKLR